MTPFICHPLIPSGHMQTVAAIFCKLPRTLPHSFNHHLDLPDGDKLLLSIDHPLHDDGLKPIILLMHGLGGSGSSSYMMRHSNHLRRAGFFVVRFHHRGSGPAHLDKAREIYHSGRTADIDAALQFIGQRWPGRRSAAIGYSMSGNILLRYLGAGTHRGSGTGQSNLSPSHLSQALAVCPPIDLEMCSQALCSWQNWHIHQYLMRHIKKQASALEARRHQKNKTPLSKIMDLRTFDQLYTAPRAGFSSREDYYAICSSKNVLSGIKVPTTILAAADDPIVPSSMFNDIAQTATLKLQMESGGGHLGFISRDRTSLGDRRWLDWFVMSWALLTHGSSSVVWGKG